MEKKARMRARSPGLLVSSLRAGLVTNMARKIEVLIKRCLRPILSVMVVVEAVVGRKQLRSSVYSS